MRKVSLHHWSWSDLLTEAIVQKEHRGIGDPDQAYILGELVRYLSDPRSGAVAFEGMGSSWTQVRDAIRAGTLRKGNEAASQVAARWDDLIRYVGLTLTAELGHAVRHVLAAAERTPAARRQTVADGLVATGQFHAELSIPDTAGPLFLLADLRARQITASTEIEAPKEGTSKGRVSWLLRQMQRAPGHVLVEARTGRWSESRAATLAAVREDQSVLYPENKRELREFRLSLTGDMGLKRDVGRGSFVDSVTVSAQVFYGLVLQNLRAWKAGPPKLRKATEPGEESVETIADLVGTEPEQVADETAPVSNEVVDGRPNEAPLVDPST